MVTFGSLSIIIPRRCRRPKLGLAEHSRARRRFPLCLVISRISCISLGPEFAARTRTLPELPLCARHARRRVVKIGIRFGVVLALLLSVIPTTLALAQYQVQLPYHGNSLLRNWRNQLCLQPEYEAPNNGVAIVQQPCNPDDLYQRWSFVLHPMTGQPDSRNYKQAGIYLVVNTGSGQCLDDRDGKTADGSPVQQWTCNVTSTTMAWK